MLPVIALIGRPNVGKSTLFNRLTRSRDALVADFPVSTAARGIGGAECETRSDQQQQHSSFHPNDPPAGQVDSNNSGKSWYMSNSRCGNSTSDGAAQ